MSDWKEILDGSDYKPGTPEYFLDKVKDWEDPNPKPVIEVHENIHVVRDDLLVGGTKERIYDYMIRSDDVTKEWVFGSGSRFGYSQLGISAVCRKYGKKATFFIAKGKELHYNSVKAQELGGNIIEVNMGMLTVTQSRAKKYVAENPYRKLIDFSGDPTVIGSVIKVGLGLDFQPDEIWTVAGSGVLNLGLQLAFPNAVCYSVSIGHNLSDEEKGRSIVIRHPLKFAQECKKKDIPPFPSSTIYDAKCWSPMMEMTNDYRKDKNVLFWNVGG